MRIEKKYISSVFYSFFVALSMALSTCGDDSEALFLEVDPGENTQASTMRIISYNILEGMKNDETNNYNHFVAWLKKQNPDVLALQEANEFSQKKLEALAARYGHPYVVTNIKVDDFYPVALTSRFPIEVRRRVTRYVSHGSIFASIKGINFVVTHFWPNSYWHEEGDGLGDSYRLQEANIVLDSTIRKFPTETKWFFCGDFNSRSQKDYVTGTSGNYEVHNTIESEGYIDAIHYLYGYRQAGLTAYPFRYPDTRIDFVYGTSALFRNLLNARPIYDEFTEVYSDHPPMMVDLRY